MSLTATIAPSAQKARQENPDSFAPIPAGKYDATIVKAEVIPYSKKEDSAYKGQNALNVQLRIVDDWPTAAKRVLFARIPMFTNYAPSDKYPDGYPVHIFYQFFGAVGVPEAQVLAGNLGEIRDFLGKRVTITVALKEADDFHDDEWNDVRRFKASTATPTATGPVVAADVWGVQATPSKTDVWAPAAADVAYATAGAGKGF